jgi:hypothetical protein
MCSSVEQAKLWKLLTHFFVTFVCFVVSGVYLDSPSRFQISSDGPAWFSV